MTDPSNPNYQIARTGPPSDFVPEHPFDPPEHGSETPCWTVLFQLDSGWPVRCGLPRRAHPNHPPLNTAPPWDKAQNT